MPFYRRAQNLIYPSNLEMKAKLEIQQTLRLSGTISCVSARTEEITNGGRLTFQPE